MEDKGAMDRSIWSGMALWWLMLKERGMSNTDACGGRPIPVPRMSLQRLSVRKHDTYLYVQDESWEEGP